MVLILLDLFSEIHLHSADCFFVFTIRILNLSAIEPAVAFDDVIVSGVFKNWLADERADLQSAQADFHHCDLRFSHLIGEHISCLPPQGGLKKRLFSIIQWWLVYRR